MAIFSLRKDRIRAFLILALVTGVALSCEKESTLGGTYIVSARKMIGITSNDWSVSEPHLTSKTGYRYTKSADNLSNVIKAEVHLPAIDDSNRAVKGSILLNIAPDNRVFYAAFDAEPSAKATAYALMLNYNNDTLQTLSEITSSTRG